MSDQRQFLELRAYVDLLIGNGAIILGRNPLLLQYGDRRLRYACGMLMCEDEAEVVELA